MRDFVQTPDEFSNRGRSLLILWPDLYITLWHKRDVHPELIHILYKFRHM